MAAARQLSASTFSTNVSKSNQAPMSWQQQQQQQQSYYPQQDGNNAGPSSASAGPSSSSMPSGGGPGYASAPQQQAYQQQPQGQQGYYHQQHHQQQHIPQQHQQQHRPQQQQPPQVDRSTYAQAGYYQPPGSSSNSNSGPSGQHQQHQQQQQHNQQHDLQGQQRASRPGSGPYPASGSGENGGGGGGGDEGRRRSSSNANGNTNGHGQQGDAHEGAGGGGQAQGQAVTESGSSAAGSKESDGFEFTRRKRWAQLLIDELHDSAILALRPLSTGGCRILYASHGIKDLTGFGAKDLEGLTLGDIVHEPDLPAITSYINQSIATRVDLASFHRFKCVRPPPPPRHTDSSASDMSDSSSTDVLSSRGTRDSVNLGASGEGGLGGGRTRPVLMEVRGHGFWGEEAERMPVPVSLSLAQPPRSGQLEPSASSGRPPLLETPTGSFMGAPGPRCKAFFLMVRRWPSPATEMASTFLAEKIENERLRAELLSLEGGGGGEPPLLEGGDAAYPASIGGDGGFGRPAMRHQHSYGSAYDDSAIGGGAYDDDDSDREDGVNGGGMPGYSPASAAAASARAGGPSAGPYSHQPHPAPGVQPTGGAYNAHPQHGQQQQQNTVLGKDHPSELGKKSKKSKKSKEEGNYVCVTCGRTDSPEWRKGPLGPKTLCNACGLRYAKKQQMQAAADGTGPPVPPKKKSAPKPPGGSGGGEAPGGPAPATGGSGGQ